MPDVRRHQDVDVAVIGGGPAGAAAATLLARWGHSVTVLTKMPSPGASLGESLPPSIVKPLAAVGLRKVVEAAGFYRSRGNTVWWGEGDGRSESFPSGARGYQVVREAFDEVLLGHAETAGATVCRGAIVRDVDLEGSPRRLTYETDSGQRNTLDAATVLDCSGRAGVIARRGHRLADRTRATVALVGVWRLDDPWDVPDPTHTLVESYADGWAWSVPVSGTDRYVTVMVDPRTTDLQRSGDIERIYRRELDKTLRLARVVNGATLAREPWGRHASVYSARQFGGPGFLLVGDAASCIDPLSSFGVRKALTSAWLAAVVTRTRLRRPEMETPALELFGRRETEVFDTSSRLAASYFADVSRTSSHPFWVDRSELGDTLPHSLDEEVKALRDDPAVRHAFESLRRTPSIDLRATPAVTLTTQPAIRDDEVTLEPCLVVAGWPSSQAGVRFLRGVDLPCLVEMADAHAQVPDLFEAYGRARPQVSLPDFLGALSVLLAKGASRNLS